MMNFSSSLSLTMALASLFFLGACKKKDRIGVEYRDQTNDDTATAVAEAFSGKGLSAEEIDPEIENLFIRIGMASWEPESLKIDDLFSRDAMIEAMESGGMLAGFTDRQRREFEKGFRDGFESIRDSLGQMAYHRHRIMHVEATSENVREAIVQHYDTDLNITFPMRWWLVKTTEGWRVFDFQDLSVGLRTVELMGALISASVGTNPEPWVKDLLSLLARMKSIDMDDPEQLATLKNPLEQLLRNEMPGSIRTFAGTMTIAFYQGTDRNEEALAELEAARIGGYQSPMWHYQMFASLMAEERYDDAIMELQKHAETFGWDSDSLEGLSDCHFHAGRLDEARSAALRGLEDSPGSSQCLASMAAASTPEQLRDPSTAAHFAQSHDSESAYEVALDYLIELESRAQALALFEVFRVKHPDSDLIDYYLQELARDEGERTAD